MSSKTNKTPPITLISPLFEICLGIRGYLKVVKTPNCFTYVLPIARRILLKDTMVTKVKVLTIKNKKYGSVDQSLSAKTQS